MLGGAPNAKTALTARVVAMPSALTRGTRTVVDTSALLSAGVEDRSPTYLALLRSGRRHAAPVARSSRQPQLRSAGPPGETSPEDR